MSTTDREPNLTEQDQDFNDYDGDEKVYVRPYGIAMRIAFLLIIIAIAAVIIFGLVAIALWLKANT